MSLPSTDATVDATMPAGVESTADPRPVVELARGESLGRYLILGELGRGAMGTVYAAYDPELDRKLAIKLLRQRTRSGEAGTSSDGAMRLQREAQALAKLSHRNVVAVHDVGLHEDQVFVAMEHVEGQTLRDWMDAGPHPWPEVLDRLSEAGRGLAAAHAAGLVHRDFKPANVLLGDDGRVRVADFGLARQAGVEPSRTPREVQAQLPVSASTQLTQTGALVGTPAYMAPEQFAGSTLDARSDQFSFCVALWEALWGERPFAGDSAATIGFAIMQGELREPPASPRVPGWIRKLLERGLAADASARWPDMDSLLEALSHNPVHRRRRVLAITLGLAGLVGLALTPQLLRPAPEPPAPPLCEGADAAFAEVWGPAQREQLHARYAKLDPELGREAETHIVEQLDAWAAGWTGAWTDACAATRIRGEQSEEMLDQRMLCLDRRKTRFAAFVAELSELDDTQLRSATSRVGGIGDVADCSDPETMHARVPAPAEPARRREFDALLTRLDGIMSKIAVGRYDAAKTELEPVYAAALADGHPTLVAEASLVRGRLLTDTNDPEGEAELERAHAAALAAGLFKLAAYSARMLCNELVTTDARVEDAERWLRIAEGLATYLDDERVHLQTLSARARYARYSGDLDAAVSARRETVKLARELYGPEGMETARAHFNLSAVLFDLYEFDEAAVELAKARAIWSKELGPYDPRTLRVLDGEAVFSWKAGRLRHALETYEDLLQRKTKLYGADSIEIAGVFYNYGSMLAEAGDPKAVELLERAVESYERSYGADSVAAAQCRANLAVAIAYTQPGRGQESLALINEALALIEAKRGPEHMDVLTGYSIRVGIYARQHDWVALRREAEALRVRLEAAGQDQRPLMVEVLLRLARVELAEGRPARGLAHIEAADAMATDVQTTPRETAYRRLLFAHVLQALDREAEANAAQAEARALYSSAGEVYARDWLWQEIEAWPERKTL